MINLVKNELIKIFSKKAIYIYTILILMIMIGISILNKNVDYNTNQLNEHDIKKLESNLSQYDLNDENELRWYIGDRVIIDVNKIAAGFGTESAERYYIDTTIEPLLQEMYNKEYLEKDKEASKLLKNEIENKVKDLKKFDWKNQIKNEKKEITKELKKYQEMLLNDKNNQDIINIIKSLEINLWCLNYRLENQIPYSYNSKSNKIDLYKEYALEYLNLKDEKLVTNKSELKRIKEAKANYEITKYSLEHNSNDNSQELINYIIETLSLIDGFVVTAIILICSSIISEEFNKGTIKQLLTKPHSRAKILTSKIIASLIAICAFVLLYELTFVLSKCYEYGDFKSILGTNIIYDFNLNQVKEVSVISQCIYSFISLLPAYLIIYSIIILIGALSTNSITAMIGGFGLYLGADLLPLCFNQKQLSFIPFCNWDLTPYMYGGMNDNIYSNLGKSLIIDTITILIFIIMAYILFHNKDIKNQ